MDVWAIPAAADWRGEIEHVLLACRGCAIFLGATGWGEFHLAEARRALEHRTERPDFIVVPILLPGARKEDIAVLGEFFSDRQRIDFNGQAVAANLGTRDLAPNHVPETWSVATGRLLARVSANENGFATAAEFTPAGDALLTAGGDGIVSLWSFPKETRTAAEIAPILARLVPYRLQDGRAVLNRRPIGPE